MVGMTDHFEENTKKSKRWTIESLNDLIRECTYLLDRLNDDKISPYLLDRIYHNTWISKTALKEYMLDLYLYNGVTDGTREEYDPNWNSYD